jgi:protein-S-isoprenylcysteine O-methyltransferase Ste14
MSNAALETLIWVLIYGGLLVVCLGFFVVRSAESSVIGWAMLVGGACSSAVGAVLIYVRSRR